MGHRDCILNIEGYISPNLSSEFHRRFWKKYALDVTFGRILAMYLPTIEPLFLSWGRMAWLITPIHVPRASFLCLSFSSLTWIIEIQMFSIFILKMRLTVPLVHLLLILTIKFFTRLISLFPRQGGLRQRLS